MCDNHAKRLSSVLTTLIHKSITLPLEAATLISKCTSIMPSRTLKGALIILLVGATASFLDKFASREEFTVGELRKIRRESEYLSGHGRHEHCKGAIPRARRDDVAAAARTYLPDLESWPRERSCEPVAIRRWTCGLPAKRRRDTADNTVAKTYRKLLRTRGASSTER